MYKVFNMGHRMEIYLAPENAQRVVSIAAAYGIDARIVGRVEESDHTHLTIKSDKGVFTY